MLLRYYFRRFLLIHKVTAELFTY